MTGFYTLLAMKLGNPIPNGADTVSDSGAALGEYITVIYPVLQGVGIVAAVLVIGWGAYGYITSGGDAQQITEAKDRIVSALIGLALLLLASLLIKFIKGY